MIPLSAPSRRSGQDAEAGRATEPASYLGGRAATPATQAAAADLARQSFPAALKPSGTQAGAPSVRTRTFTRSLAQGLASGVAERTRFPAGSVAEVVERVRFGNGTQVVYKVVRLAAEADGEVLSSLVGRAIGAPVPAIAQVGQHELYIELMPGRPAAEVLKTRGEEKPYLQTRNGLLLGALDAIIYNVDRNAGNWLIGDDGTIAGIDHSTVVSEAGCPGISQGTIEPGSGAHQSPFARYWFLRRRDDASYPEWSTNVLHRSDVDTWLRAVSSLQPEFVTRGYADWWQAITGRLRAIRSHARGPEPWLAAQKLPNSRSPERMTPSSRRSRSPRTAR